MTACLVMAMPAMSDDDIMITRDGSMITVKVEKISSSQVTFTDLKHKKRGRLNAPTDYVYMIMKEKGNNIFFDEDGNQTTSKVVKYGKKDNVMFTNDARIIVVYNVSVGKEEVTCQLKDKKKAPIQHIKKSDIFMIRNADGTNTLYNDSYQQKARQQAAQATVTSSAIPNTQPIASPTATATQSAERALLATTGVTQADFHPAPELTAVDIEKAINEKNPYTLYRKGSVAEYCFQHNGKQTQYRGGPTYVQQIVEDEKIENGLLTAYIRQAFFNKKHEPSKGIMASYKECLFPTEIDTAGTYHWTHNILQDFMIISKRRGFAMLITNDMTPGMKLKCSTLHDNAKTLIGGTVSVETVYSDWQVVNEESISTPAGTFQCLKLTGKLAQKTGKGNFAGETITCWIARGIGIVQYESIADSDKTREPFVMYLNKLDLK